MEIKTIVFATDFSAVSQEALQTALSLARETGAELHLFHVIEPVGGAGDDLFPAVDLVEAGYKQSRRQLRELVPREDAAELHIESACSTGTPSAEIAAYARHVGADMIVVGTHGRKGLSRVLMGSTAEKLLRKAPCKVLVVKGAA